MLIDELYDETLRASTPTPEACYLLQENNLSNSKCDWGVT